MDLVSQGPLRVASLRFLLSNGAPALTVVCKATFSLRPGESPLAPQQDEPNEDDTYWDDDPQRSLSASTDLVPFKARADVLLIGSAYSQAPARSLVARLGVGAVDKSIEVHADRAIGADGGLREGMLFTRMRLRYERAAGGPETANPVGMRFDVPDARGNLVLPNLQPVGAQIARRGDTFSPVGFGPLAPGWWDRAQRAQRSAPGWSPYGWTERPLPEGFDASFFNVAPADQQLDSLQADETIVLTHLHAEHPRFQTRLPDVMPRAVVERPGAPPQPLALVCDTLSIDTDRGVCHLVWRATVRLSHPAEAGRVVVSLGEAQSPPGWDSAAPPEAGDRTVAPMMGAGPGMAALFPFARGRTQTDITAPRKAADMALPFQREGASREAPSPAAPPPPAAPPSKPAFSVSSGPVETTRVFELPQTPSFGAPPAPPPPGPPPPPAPPPPPGPLPVALPPAAPPPISLTQSGMMPALNLPGPPMFGPPPAPPPPPQAPAPLPPPAPPLAVPAARPAVESSPWASGAAPADTASSTGSFGERMLAEPPPGPSPDTARRGGEPESLGALARPTDTAVPSFLAAAAVAGVVAASNAAADPLPPPKARGPAARPAFQRSSSDAVDLLWFDPESVARIRKKPAWRALLTDLENAPEVDSEEAALGNNAEEIEDRRDVLHVLVHGSAIDEIGIQEALDGGVRADGKIINPLVLTAGQLAFTFDELEMLKATLSCALPFAQGDEPLTAATAAAKDFLSTPGLLATGPVIESLTVRIREAFTRVRRPVPADYLSVQPERALLEKRHYQKREVLSATHLRGLFFPPGSDNPVPAYLPEAIAKKLPLYQRFSVRMIVEVHRTADQIEPHPAALKALAVGRTLPPKR